MFTFLGFGVEFGGTFFAASRCLFGVVLFCVFDGTVFAGTATCKESRYSFLLGFFKVVFCEGGDFISEFWNYLF